MRQFDLVSMGGGLAGLVAAVRAQELGLRVAVLEAGGDDAYPCNSRFAGGILHVAYQDVQQSPEALLEGLRRAGVAESAQATAIASTAGRALDWLRAQGARFAHLPHLKRGAWVMAPPRPMLTGFMRGEAWYGRGPDRTLRTLTKNLLDRGGKLLRATRGESLVMRDGRCGGLVVSAAEGTTTITTDAVVLADGGFSGNAAMFRRYIGPAPERVLQRGAGTGRGDALRIAIEAGAATTPLDRFYGHLLSRDAFENDALWPYPQIDAIAAAGIVVDATGQRLFDEGLGGIYASNHLATLDDPACATVVLDAAIWNGPGRGGLVPPNPLLMRHGATVHVAADLESLARACAMPASQLVATVRGYNDALQRRALDRLVPARTELKARAMPIVEPPFMAIPICSGITNTMGGVSIDGDARVLAVDRRPIPGLYAAGACTGGLEGGPHVDYVGGLVKAVVFGLRAAEHAASVRATVQEESLAS